jgi:geranylgeranyl reductase
VRARAVIGADGANSAVAREAMPTHERVPFRVPPITRSSAPRRVDGAPGFDGSRCDVYYQGRLSPDFYAWIFPRRDRQRRHRLGAQGLSLKGLRRQLREIAA